MKKKETEMPLNVVLGISSFISNGHELEYIFQCLLLKLLFSQNKKTLKLYVNYVHMLLCIKNL